MENYYQEVEKFYRSKGWGLRMGFGKRPAIVAIDLCKAWLDPSNPLGSTGLEGVVENLDWKGSLIIREKNGSIKTIISGDVF